MSILVGVFRCVATEFRGWNVVQGCQINRQDDRDVIRAIAGKPLEGIEHLRVTDDGERCLAVLRNITDTAPVLEG